MRKFLPAVLALILAAGTSLYVRAQPAPPSAGMGGPPAGVAGYLGGRTSGEALVLLTPPPTPKSPEGRADRAVYNATRKLQGSDRWSMATADADARLPGALRAFDCAVGADLDPAKAPVLFKVMRRSVIDAGGLVGPAKDHFARPRPMIGNIGATCTPRSEILGGSYPSGHSTAGWTWAMILAELAPDRAAQILARGRAYGDSRVVCGAHYVTDVQAGLLLGSATVAQLNANAEFQSDMKAARAELDALRAAGGPPAGQCAAEAKLVADPGY